MMTRSEKVAGIVGLISLVPYLLVAWSGTLFLGGDTKVFGKVFGALIGVRMVFAVIECLGGILAWRVYGKRVAVDSMLKVLQSNNFPPRYHRHDDFPNYLQRVEDDFRIVESVRAEAKLFYRMLATWEESGILAGTRMHSASEIALEAYSPRALAPEFQASP